MKKIAIPLVLLLGLFWWFRTPSVTAPNSDISFSYTIERTGGGGWRETLPLLVALHGNGDTPKNFFDTALPNLTARARVVCIRAPEAMGAGYAWPMDPGGVSRYAGALAGAIARLADTYATAGRPVVFGFSGGAVMAYALAAAYPDRFSVIVPVSGRLPAGQKGVVVPGGDGPEIIAFHGTADTLIAPGGGRAAVRALRDLGRKTELRERTGGASHGLS